MANQDQPQSRAAPISPEWESPLRTGSWLLGGLLTVALLWLLHVGYSVFLPLAIAFFLAVAVLPLSQGIRRRVPPSLGWLGYVAAAGIIIGVLLLFLAGIGVAASQIAANADQIVRQFQQRLGQTPLGDLVAGQGLPQLLSRAGGFARSLLAGLGSTLGALVVIFFLMLLMLLEAGEWRAKLETVSPGDGGRRWREVSKAVGQKFRRYFVSRLILGSITGALYAGWLAIFGTPLLLVWGILALLLNFVPTIGSLIAGILPVLFLFAQTDVTTALIAGGGILVIEQVMGNYIDPKITGRQLSLSPLVVLVSLLLWSWVWGIPGALIATPMTMLLAIAFAHIGPLRPVALLLSEETDMAGLARAMAPTDRPSNQGDEA